MTQQGIQRVHIFGPYPLDVAVRDMDRLLSEVGRLAGGNPGQGKAPPAPGADKKEKKEREVEDQASLKGAFHQVVMEITAFARNVHQAAAELSPRRLAEATLNLTGGIVAAGKEYVADRKKDAERRKANQDDDSGTSASELGMEAGAGAATEAAGAAGGPAGIAIATAAIAIAGAAVVGTKALMSFARGVDATAEKLGQFNGQIAGAQGMAQARQIVGDVGRGELLSKELSNFVDAQSKLSNTAQDALAELLRPLIPLVTIIVEGVDKLLTQQMPNIEKFADSMVDGINKIIMMIDVVIQVAIERKKFEFDASKYLKAIDRNTRKDLTPEHLFDLTDANVPGLDGAAKAIRDLLDQLKNDPDGRGGPRPAFGGM